MRKRKSFRFKAMMSNGYRGGSALNSGSKARLLEGLLAGRCHLTDPKSRRGGAGGFQKQQLQVV